MATLYDVCNKTGLSTATVSRVINGSELVKEATRKRVHQAMEELNYRPNQAARMLAGGKTDTIGVVLPVIDNGYYVQVLHGIDTILTMNKRKLLISFFHSDIELLELLASLSGEGRTDGIIVMNNTFLPSEKIRELTGDDFPIALIGQDDGSTDDIDSILIDNVQGAYSAVECLLEHKPKSLLLLTGPEDNHDSNERLKGAQKAIRGAPYDVDVTILQGNFLFQGGRGVFSEHISKEGLFPDAVFAFNDDMALGVIDSLNNSPRKIPEDIQIIGFDDNLLAQCVGLSTVSVPMWQIGEEAAQLVVNRIKEKDGKSTHVVLKTKLVVRNTTKHVVEEAAVQGATTP